MTPEQKKRAREEVGDITKLTPKKLKEYEARLAKKKKGEKENKKNRERTNPPPKSEIRSLSKKQDDDDAIRTRTFNKNKKNNPIINALHGDTQAKNAGNSAADGDPGGFFMGYNVGEKKSRKGRLDEAVKLSKTLKNARSWIRFMKRTRDKDKKKSDATKDQVTGRAAKEKRTRKRK
jgi:hypothetical protein